MTFFKKSYLLAIIMASLPLLVYLARPSDKLADTKEKLVLDQAIPQQFGEWRLDANSVATVEAPSRESLYDQVLSRSYVNSQNQKIMLTIAYGSAQTTELKIHQQEVCYHAGGFEIEKLSHKTLSVLNNDIYLTQFYGIKRNRNEPVTYWFTIGNKVILNRLQHNIMVLKYAFSGVIPDGYLIRVSNISNNPALAFTQHEKFIQDFMAALPENVSERLLGSFNGGKESKD